MRQGPIMRIQAAHRISAQRGDRELGTFLIDLSVQDMWRRLGDALAVYVDAMRYPRGTENQRAAMWLEHTRRPGWQAVAAVEADCADGELPPATELAQAR